MPAISRPDGVELHYEQRGEGPLAVLALGALSVPTSFEALIAVLSGDHRVVVYDPRGAGESTRTGPYDMATDRADLAALVEHLGGEAVVICNASACHLAVRLASERPELVRHVVAPGGTPIGRSRIMESEGLAASDSVIEIFVEQLRNDYRGALRATIPGMNPQLDEAAVRERVDRQEAYMPREAAVERTLAWIESDETEAGRALGDRLWLLLQGDNPWFPQDTTDISRKVLPEANVEDVPDGPVSRPDITAGVVRRVSARVRA
jgi:pimeloyl-ACP methyl ester carboxylesterase